MDTSLDPKVCCIKGCNKAVLALGLCTNHWRRNRKYGSPVAMKRHGGMLRGMSAEARFWLQVKKTDDCWIWTSSRDRDGYGIFKGNVRGVPYRKAHRFSYALHRGDVPHGVHVLHACDNPWCVNPAHLSLGTNADNMADKIAKGRALGPIGIANHSAVLTEDQVMAVALDPRPYAGIAADYGITPQTVGDIKNRRSWRHLEVEPVKGKKIGPNRGKSDRLDPDKVRAIRASSESLKSLSERYGVSIQTVCDIRKRRSWRHVA